MKKLIMGISIAVFIIVITLGTTYFIDMNRINDNRPIVFSTWGYDYTHPEPDNSDIDFTGGVILGNGSIHNISRLNDFIDNANKGESDSVTIFRATIEGDYIITYLTYTKDGEYEVKVDNSFDRFAGEKSVTTNTYSGKVYDIKKIKEDKFYRVKLIPNELVCFATVPDEVNICTYEADLEDKNNGENSFIGTVLEETTTYMIVKPNPDEYESKSYDKIRVNYVTNHIDYLYGVGRKVLIRYSGYIKETYPAQIDTDDISTEGYEDFEIIVKKDDKLEKRKVVNARDIDKYNSEFDLYYYGLSEVNVNVNGEELSLEKALKDGKVTLNTIIAKANRDAKLGHITSDIYKDGGSKIYWYEDYTIIKCHTLDGDRDVYIGVPSMTMNNKG